MTMLPSECRAVWLAQNQPRQIDGSVLCLFTQHEHTEHGQDIDVIANATQNGAEREKNGVLCTFVVEKVLILVVCLSTASIQIDWIMWYFSNNPRRKHSTPTHTYTSTSIRHISVCCSARRVVRRRQALDTLPGTRTHSHTLATKSRVAHVVRACFITS